MLPLVYQNGRKHGESPSRGRICAIRRGAISPALERRIVTAARTGSFEKAARVCGARGCEPGDDRAMTAVRKVGEACQAAGAPKACDCAAPEGLRLRGGK